MQHTLFKNKQKNIFWVWKCMNFGSLWTFLDPIPTFYLLVHALLQNKLATVVIAALNAAYVVQKWAKNFKDFWGLQIKDYWTFFTLITYLPDLTILQNKASALDATHIVYLFLGLLKYYFNSIWTIFCVLMSLWSFKHNEIWKHYGTRWTEGKNEVNAS